MRKRNFECRGEIPCVYAYFGDFYNNCFCDDVNKAGSYDFSAFSTVLANNPHFRDVVFLLALIGFGVKAGFVPFHNWLPEAHPAAPSHVSAIMSGVMIKTGIYGILRILSLGGCPSKALCYAVLGISIITFLYGILYAIGQNDVKKMLAYSSIENIGIIGSGLGVFVNRNCL